MPLANRRFDSATLISPINCYPGHSYGSVCEDIARGLYFSSQWDSRVIFMQSYGFDIRDPQGDATSIRRSRAAGAFMPFARARRNIPNETSHVRCIYIFAVVEFHSAIFNAQLTITDASANVDTGTNSMVTDEIIPTGQNSIRSQSQEWEDQAAYPFTAGNRIYVHDLSVKLANASIATPGRCRVFAEAYATRELGNAAVAVWPLFAIGLAEMRYY